MKKTFEAYGKPLKSTIEWEQKRGIPEECNQFVLHSGNWWRCYANCYAMYVLGTYVLAMMEKDGIV